MVARLWVGVGVEPHAVSARRCAYTYTRPNAPDGGSQKSQTPPTGVI